MWTHRARSAGPRPLSPTDAACDRHRHRVVVSSAWTTTRDDAWTHRAHAAGGDATIGCWTRAFVHRLVLILLFYARGARAFQPSNLSELKTAVDHCLKTTDTIVASGAGCTATSDGQPIAIADWDTSSVTSMNRLFENRFYFDANISAWNTAAVTDMAYMFSLASAFNQDISG